MYILCHFFPAALRRKITPPLIEIQKAEIVHYMRTHSNFAKQRIAKLGHSGRVFCDRKWKELTESINKFDGPKFTQAELQTVCIFF